MCRHCETKCSSKQTKQCPKTRVICSLPYPITKSGHYCLGKDFQWSDSTKSAITVLADNVVLDFNHRIITTDVASDVPLVSVTGSTDVELKNVHLKGVGAGKYSRGGLVINESSKVTVNSAVLKNLGVDQNGSGETFVARNANELTISNHCQTNDNDVVEGGGSVTGFLISACSNVMFKESKLRNTRALFQNVQNTLISRVQIDNSDASGIRGFQIITEASFALGGKKTDGVRVTECEVSTLNTEGIFVASFPILPEPDLLTRNVLIENTTVRNVGYAAIRFQIVDDCQVKNCFLHTDGGEGSFSYGVFLLIGNRNVIENNTIECANGADTGIVFEDFQLVTTTSSNVFRGNIVSRDDSPLSGNLTEPPGSYGILGISNGSIYNTVDGNVVSCFTFGYSDSTSLVPGESTAICTIFSNNIANGNVVHFDTDPVNSLLVNNIEGCNKPPLPEEQARALRQGEKKSGFPTKLAEKN